MVGHHDRERHKSVVRVGRTARGAQLLRATHEGSTAAHHVGEVDTLKRLVESAAEVAVHGHGHGLGESHRVVGWRRLLNRLARRKENQGGV